jgi:hypothetical protein
MSETTVIKHCCPSCGANVEISTSVTTTVIEQPQYASIGGVTMRRVNNGYWRDNGRWGCEAEWKDSKLMARSDHEKLHKRISEHEVIPISRTEWAKENGNSV